MKLMVVRLLLACCAVVLLLAPASAQSVVGRVYDAESGLPIAGVKITMIRPDGSKIGEVITSSVGSFNLNARGAGQVRLVTGHIGYQSLTTDIIDIASQEQVVANLKLAATAIAVDPLTIVARQRDQRQDATEEGMYSRRLLFPQIGNRRVILPFDPEMMGAIDVRDVLTTLPRVRSAGRGCLTVFWNGTVVGSPDVVADLLTTSVTQLEAVEYYRSKLDAPFAFRELPIYQGFENSECSILALWQRTGKFLALDPPPPLPPFPWRVYATASVYHLAGTYAPGTGVGLEFSTNWPLYRAANIGLHLRITHHTVSAETADSMTSTLSDFEYRMPPGERGLLLWVLGVEPKLPVFEDDRVRITAGPRLQLAQRRFSLVKNEVGDRAISITSMGAGIGASAAADITVRDNLSVTLGLNQDWFTFRKYNDIDRSTTPTAATWRGTALHAGVAYHLGGN